MAYREACHHNEWSKMGAVGRVVEVKSSSALSMIVGHDAQESKACVQREASMLEA